MKVKKGDTDTGEKETEREINRNQMRQSKSETG